MSLPTSFVLPACARPIATFLVVAALSACGGGGSGAGTSGGEPAPDAPLAIASSTPADGAVGVDRGVRPELTLSAAVAPGAVRLSDPRGAVAAGVAMQGPQVRVSPERRLLPLTAYTLQVADGPALRFTTADGAWNPAAKPLENGTAPAQLVQLAMDAQGHGVAVWQSSEGTDLRVRASRYEPSTGWAAPELLGNGYAPQIAADAAGHAVALWARTDPGTIGIWSSRYTPGTGWSAPVALDLGTEVVNLPRIASNARGDVVAVWLRADPGQSRYSVYSRRYVPGDGWQPVRRVEQADTQAYDAVVAVNPEGVATVVWAQSDNVRFNALASRSDRIGAWSAAVELDTTSNSVGSPVLAVSDDGSFMAGWTQWSGTFIELWTRRADPAGRWDAAARADQAPSGVESPRLALDAAGGAVAVWVQNESADRNVWSNRYVPGQGWGVAVRVEATAFDPQQPRVAVDASGNALVVWQQQEAVGRTVMASRQPAGGAWSAPTRIGSARVVDADAAVLAMDASGSVLAAWSEYEDSTGDRLLFNRFD